MSSIVWNLFAYLKAQFPGEKIYIAKDITDGDVQTQDRFILIKETGGEERRVIEVPTYQIMIRDFDYPKAKKFAEQVKNSLVSQELIGGRFGLILPTGTDGTNSYPAVQVSQISLSSSVGYVGNDDNGRPLFSMNIQIYN
jgi:hypothetical protein